MPTPDEMKERAARLEAEAAALRDEASAIAKAAKEKAREGKKFVFQQRFNMSSSVRVVAKDMYEADEILMNMSHAELLEQLLANRVDIDRETSEFPEEIGDANV